MTRKLVAVVVFFVFTASLVVQNLAYMKIIERRLKLCSSARDNNSRVPGRGSKAPSQV